MPNINVSKGEILKKNSETENCKKSSNGNNKTNDDDMPSNNENEDSIPKPTNGCGVSTVLCT